MGLGGFLKDKFNDAVDAGSNALESGVDVFRDGADYAVDQVGYNIGTSINLMREGYDYLGYANDFVGDIPVAGDAWEAIQNAQHDIANSPLGIPLAVVNPVFAVNFAIHHEFELSGGADFTIPQMLDAVSAMAEARFARGAELPDMPAMTMEELTGEAERVLSVEQTADFYARTMDGRNLEGWGEEFSLDDVAYHQKEFIDDRDTGFKGAIYMNDEGHAVVVMAGMNAFVDPGSFDEDAESFWQAKFGKVDNQLPQAQELYEHALNMSDSVEVIGYSMGSMHANYLAARLGAQVTNLSDIGLPDIHQDGESIYGPEHIQRIKDNVVSVRIEGDEPPWYAGKIYNDEIVIPVPAFSSAEEEQAYIERIVSRAEELGSVNSEGISGHFNAHSEGYDALAHIPAAYDLAMEEFFAGMEEPAPAMDPSITPDYPFGA